MTFSTATILVVVLIACLLVVGADRIHRKRQPDRADERATERSGWVVLARSLLIFLIPVMLVVGFVVQPFRIPSGSMIPTLSVGDVVLVNKYAYGLRLPWGNIKLLGVGHPSRGDVVVFRFPGYQCLDDGQLVRTGDQSCSYTDTPVPPDDWIKRVIGLPGDRVQMQGTVLSINGKVVPTRLIGPFQGHASRVDDRLLMRHKATVSEQTLDGRSYQIAEMRGYNTPDPIPSAHLPAVLPPDCYLVLGDDRNNSIDSRWWGCVPESALVGRADRVAVSWGPTGFDSSRIGIAID